MRFHLHKRLLNFIASSVFLQQFPISMMTPFLNSFSTKLEWLGNCNSPLLLGKVSPKYGLLLSLTQYMECFNLILSIGDILDLVLQTWKCSKFHLIKEKRNKEGNHGITESFLFWKYHGYWLLTIVTP